MKAHPFTLIVHRELHNNNKVKNNACVDLCAPEEEEERGSDPLIRELDLDTVAARVPADLLEPSQEEHTPSSSHQSPPEVHAQRGEGEVHLLTW